MNKPTMDSTIVNTYDKSIRLFYMLRRVTPLRILKSSQLAITLLMALFWLVVCFYMLNSKGSDVSVELPEMSHRYSMIGSVNYDEWLCAPFIGYLVDDLRIHHHQWPNHPTNRRTASSVHVYHERILHMGAKVYGYILPPITGSYQFRILQRACKAVGLSGELWISADSNPMNLIKITELTYFVKNIGFFTFSDVSKAVSVDLHDNQKYYFEFHVKGHKGRIDMLVEWKLPQEYKFKSIPSSYLSLAFNIHESNSNPLLSNDLPSNRLQSIGYTKHISYNVAKITDFNILPECELPKPFISLPVRYNPFILISAPESSMYPPDTNRYFDASKLGSSDNYLNNKQIPLTTVENIERLYKEALKKQDKYKGKVLGVHYLEETYNEGYGGSRFLLEMNVQLQNGIVRTSEYVYLPKDGSKLCHTTNFQWDQNVHVTLLITMKNVGQWVDHLIYKLEDIYQETKDENFELVVLDFHSKDKDIEGALKKSSLPKWKYIPLEGKFFKTLALQTGIDYVKDKNSIVMTLDMHLNLPPNFIESARKHTIQGKMAYAPMVLRLDEGYTENHPNGYWEIYGYGLFSMYKTDWIAVGGWNMVIFKHQYGGEDIELYERVVVHGYDVFRCRLPGLFHYYHTKDGLWENHLSVKDLHNC